MKNTLLSNLFEIMFVFGLVMVFSGSFLRYGVDVALLVSGGLVIAFSTFMTILESKRG